MSDRPALRRLRTGAVALVATVTMIAGVLLAGPAAAGVEPEGPTLFVNTTADVVNDPADCTEEAEEGDCSLRDAIILANQDPGPDVIAVPDGDYYLQLVGSEEDGAQTGDLDITEDVEIVAVGDEGAKVDAGDMANPGGDGDRAFHVHSVAVTIDGLSIAGGAGVTRGGGLLIEPESDVTLRGVAVIYNEAEGYGGGIYNNMGSSLTLDDSRVASNSALEDPDPEPCEFEPCPPTGNGGGIYNEGHLEMSATWVGGETEEESNLAHGMGGGIYTASFGEPENGGGTLIVEGSQIAWNAAAYDGGGIASDNDQVQISSSQIFDNVAGQLPGDAPTGGSGGGISSFVFGDALDPGAGTDLEITDSFIFRNRAVVAPCEFDPEFPCGGYGGGIRSFGHAELTDTQVGGDPDEDASADGNIAEEEGGGIATVVFPMHGEPECEDGFFFDWDAEECVPEEEGGTLIISGGSIAGNAAAHNGGGISNQGDRVELTGARVVQNTAGRLPGEDATGGNGGGIYTSADGDGSQGSAGLYVESSNILLNNAIGADVPCHHDPEENCPEGGNGGGIYNEGHAEIHLTDVGNQDGEGNSATGSGGGIFTTPFVGFDHGPDPCGEPEPPEWCDEPGTLLFVQSDAEGNYAGQSGGGIYNQGDHVEVINSVVDANVAEENGGGIYTEAFFDFGEGCPEGTIFDPDLNDCIPDEELPECEEGEVWNGEECEAGEGGGATLILEASLVNDNHAGRDGGGIYNRDDRLVLRAKGEVPTEVRRNTAGAVPLPEDQLDIRGGDGGGIWTSGEPFDEGGGDECDPEQEECEEVETENGDDEVSPGLYVSESEITHNRALANPDCDPEDHECYPGGNGGGISNHGHTELVDSEVSNNEADASGGGIWTQPFFDCGPECGPPECPEGTNWDEGEQDCVPDDPETLVLVGTRVNGNEAGAGVEEGGNGGGIWADSDLVEILSASAITGNKAYAGLCDFGGEDSFPCNGDGGGIYSSAGHAEVVNSLVSENEAEGNGGGIWTMGEGPGFCEGEECDEEPENGGDETLIVSGSEVTENVAGRDGGGIWNQGDHVEVVEGSNISHNRALGFEAPCHHDPEETCLEGGEGGGIWTQAFFPFCEGEECDPPETLLVHDSSVNDNWASRHGGGIYNDSDTAEVAGSEIRGNTAGTNGDEADVTGGDGGGIWSDTHQMGELSISSTTVEGNTALVGEGDYEDFAGNGGGIWSRGPASVQNSTVSGNAAGDAGGIYTGVNGGPESTLSLDSVTVADNDATSEEASAGGIRTGGDFSVTELFNSIVANNTAPDCEGDFQSNGFNLDSDDSCDLGEGTDLPNTEEPGLADLAGNGGLGRTHALNLGSPAIDKGPADANEGCLSTDQRGRERPQGVACDMGAYEAGPRMTGVTLNCPAALDVGQKGTCTATVEDIDPFGEASDPEGNVIFSVDPVGAGSFTVPGGEEPTLTCVLVGNEDGTSQCAIDYKPLHASTHVVTAEYEGSETHASSLTEGEIEVDPGVSYQPDGKISKKRTSGYVGNNRYNTSGAGQTVAVKRKRGKGKTFFIKAQNDGDAVDSFFVQGCKSGGGFKVIYLKGARGSTKITNKVVNGTFKFNNVKKGGQPTFRMKIRVGAKTKPGKVKTCKVTLTSQNDGTKKDAVRGRVTARR